MKEWLKNLSKSVLSSVMLFLILFGAVYLGIYVSFIFPLTFLIISAIFGLFLWFNKGDKILVLKSKIVGTEGWMYLSWILVAIILSFLLINIFPPFSRKFAEIYLLLLLFPLIVIAIFAKWRIYVKVVSSAYDVSQTIKQDPLKMKSNQKFKTPKFSAPVPLIELLHLIIIILTIATVFVYSFG